MSTSSSPTPWTVSISVRQASSSFHFTAASAIASSDAVASVIIPV